MGRKEIFLRIIAAKKKVCYTVENIPTDWSVGFFPGSDDMINLSVKKPYTVFVAVILIVVLGVISFTNMTTDLLPSMEFPYIMVITTYPGASPEKVEAAVTKPLESVLGTTSGLKNISSSSQENASMITLEFEQSTNMDSAMIEVSNNIDLVSGQLDDAVGTPMFLSISADMLPVMVASVDMGEGADTAQVAKFVEETVVPAFERLDGVASVTAMGLTEPTLKVTVNEIKINELNELVKDDVEASLDEAYDQLRSARSALSAAQAKLDSSAAASQEQIASASADVTSMIASLNSLLAEKTVLEADRTGFEAEKTAMEQLAQLTSSYPAMIGALLGAIDPSLHSFADIADEAAYTTVVQPALAAAIETNPSLAPLAPVAAMTLEEAKSFESKVLSAPSRIPEIETELVNIETRLQVIAAMEPSVSEGLAQAEQGYAQLTSGQMTAANKLAAAQAQILLGQSKIDEGIEEFEAARETALEQADLKNIITESMISGILTANNFSMPAGYLEDETGKYLVKVGDVYHSTEELGNTLLFHLEATGDVRIRDVGAEYLGRDLRQGQRRGRHRALVSKAEHRVDRRCRAPRRRRNRGARGADAGAAHHAAHESGRLY